MISYFEANLSQLSIHKVGNQQQGDPFSLSAHSLVIKEEVLNNLLMQYFLKPFEKTIEYYQFYHSSGKLELNEVFHFVKEIFATIKSFHSNTEQIAKHLYDVSKHPNIKAGELYVVHFLGVQVEGELCDAIGIFKSESKEPFLTVAQNGPEFTIGYEEQGININKLDKGCLVFNMSGEEGYKVAVIDQTNKTDAVYWVDDFLKLKVLNDDYTKTNLTLSLYKNFVTKELDEDFELTKTDKIDLLNRSINYFKEKDAYTLDEFASEVIGDPKGIQLFKDYKQQYETESDTKLEDSFAISSVAVKKQARHFKSVLKLDKNFHIYIHGDKELIEQGFDKERNMNYYKVYYRTEQ